MDRRDFCVKVLCSSMAAGCLASLSSAESAAGSKKLKWHKNLRAAHKLALEADKPLLIVFSASWCQPCKRLERETLSDERVIAAIERQFIPVHLDIDVDTKVAKILEVELVPCTVVLSPEADLLQKSTGFADPKGYLKILKASLERHAAIQQVQVQEP